MHFTPQLIIHLIVQSRGAREGTFDVHLRMYLVISIKIYNSVYLKMHQKVHLRLHLSCACGSACWRNH